MLEGRLLIIGNGQFGWHESSINNVKNLRWATLLKVDIFNILYIKNIIKYIILYLNYVWLHLNKSI